MVVHDDWLMRQLMAFSLGVARQLGAQVEQELEEDVEDLFASDLKHLQAMSDGALATMFHVENPRDARRALGVAALMARDSWRAEREGDADGALRLRNRARGLVEQLMARAADGRREEIVALHEALQRPVGALH